MTGVTQLDDRHLNDRYEFMQILGQGTMGLVYLAQDLVLDIPVAVKVLRPELMGLPEMVSRFDQEARLAGRMLSPHIVKVLRQTMSSTGVPMIVYEYLPGETLAARLTREVKLPLSEVATIVLQASRALSRVHTLGVLHRDLKPDNLFLVAQPGGRTFLKLLDFGVAELLDRPGGAADGPCAGTPEYIAPEALFGSHRPDARTDLYALGVVAYECLTGECPFVAESLTELFERVEGGKRKQVRDTRPELPGEIEEWMDRALHHDAFWRFTSARELADALELVVRAAEPRGKPLLRAA